MKREIDLTFIAPLFSHGATDDPEVRPASIRGQLHAWFRFVGGTLEQERSVFGGIAQTKSDFPGHENSTASKIVVRVSHDVPWRSQFLATLPHKQRGNQPLVKEGGDCAARRALVAGSACHVEIFDRLGGLKGAEALLFEKALNAWLLMGGLGYRTTRAGGSFVWSDSELPMPNTPTEYEDTCRDLIEGLPGRMAVLDRDYASAEAARRDITDSLGGPNRREDQHELEGFHYPLGYVDNHQRPNRKSSPLAYRILKFGEKYRVLAFWDGRTSVTHNTEDDFYGVVDLLAEKKADKIGAQLKKAFG